MKGTTMTLLSVLALAGCGSGASASPGLRSAADDLVRGTSFQVKSVAKTGDDSGTAVAEGPGGSEIRITLAEDATEAGKFILDGCVNVEGTEADCSELDLP